MKRQFNTDKNTHMGQLNSFLIFKTAVLTKH